MFLAVDATPTRWAVYRLSGPERMPSQDEMRCGVFKKKMLIDDAECFALSEAVLWSYTEDAAVSVIANDNQVVGYSYRKGFAKGRKDGEKAEVMDDLIKNLELTDAGMVIVIGDVPGILNVSDIGTRPRKVYSEENKTLRLRATWEVLQQAWENYKRTAATSEGSFVRDVHQQVIAFVIRLHFNWRGEDCLTREYQYTNVMLEWSYVCISTRVE